MILIPPNSSPLRGEYKHNLRRALYYLLISRESYSQIRLGFLCFGYPATKRQKGRTAHALLTAVHLRQPG